MHIFWSLGLLAVGGTEASNIRRREASWSAKASSQAWTPSGTSSPSWQPSDTSSPAWSGAATSSPSWAPTSTSTPWSSAASSPAWSGNAAAQRAAPTNVNTWSAHVSGAASTVVPSSLWIDWPSSAAPSASAAADPLSNALQVGRSNWGSLSQRHLPKWIDTPFGKAYDEAPWGDCTTKTCSSASISTMPNTNVTRHYSFSISRGVLSPDGVARNVLLINGQYPGPLIQANWGDWVEVTVTNNICEPEEGTALHMHGLLQAGSQWQDGVPGVSQCPIAPGESYKYTFQATQFGTSMYHSHYSAQYTAGVVGPMVVYGPSSLDYDIDLGPVMVSDWNHIPYFAMVNNIMTMNLTAYPPSSDSGLINGRGRFDCSKPSYGTEYDDATWLASGWPSGLTWSCVDGAERAKFKFQSGKVHRLRLVNIGADGFQRFSIDGHKMTVIALDFVPVNPYTTDTILLGIGQRADVLITAGADSSSSWWMRSEALSAATCGGLAPPGTGNIPILAGVYYEDADTASDPTSLSSNHDPSCDNAAIDITQPEYPIKPSDTPYYQSLVLELTANATGSYEWTINGQTYRADYNNPILYEAQEGTTSFPDNPEYNVYNFANNASVILNITNATPFPHPIHMHGHDFYVLSVGGVGAPWDASVVNPSNPMRRDTQIVPALGHIAIQFEANNPGVWPLHCHVAWHLSGGWYINIMSQPDQLQNIPTGARDLTCKAWDAWTNQHTVDQIDAGS